jgi:hypothetical protein
MTPYQGHINVEKISKEQDATLSEKDKEFENAVWDYLTKK